MLGNSDNEGVNDIINNEEEVLIKYLEKHSVKHYKYERSSVCCGSIVCAFCSEGSEWYIYMATAR